MSAVPYIAVVADDLTGASDTSVQFVQNGWRTQLSLMGAEQALQTQSGQASAHAVEVVALTTRSRAMAAQAAAACVTQAVKTLREAGVRRMYKKVDSTLRGAFGAEIEAARAAWRDDAIAVVCPAFPAAGRTLRDGVLYVNGVPVTETSAATDPVTPVTQKHVPTLLQCALVSPLQDESAQALASRIAAAGKVVVVDAQTDADLQRVAKAVGVLGERALPVGAGGLAQHLAHVWSSEQTRRPVLVVVTSQHSAARDQSAVLKDYGAPMWSPALETMADAAQWSLWCDRVVAESADHGDAPVWLLQAAEGRHAALDSDRVAQLLGELAARWINSACVMGVVATGGDGATAVLQAVQANGIALLGEVAAGVPFGTLTGGPSHGLPVVTKAGGFGNRDVLLQAAQTIRNRRFAR